jgi:HEAT repeat protein
MATSAVPRERLTRCLAGSVLVLVYAGLLGCAVASAEKSAGTSAREAETAQPDEASIAAVAIWMRLCPGDEGQARDSRGRPIDHDHFVAIGRGMQDAPAVLRWMLITGDTRVWHHDAIHALASLGGPADGPLFADLLGRLDPGTRFAAARAIGMVGYRAGVEKLMFVARHDPMPYVRTAACQTLGDLGDPSARPALEDALSDKDPFVRELARQALAQLDAGTDGATGGNANGTELGP